LFIEVLRSGLDHRLPVLRTARIKETSVAIPGSGHAIP
jgi:hypothetical protein